VATANDFDLISLEARDVNVFKGDIFDYSFLPILIPGRDRLTGNKVYLKKSKSVIKLSWAWLSYM